MAACTMSILFKPCYCYSTSVLGHAVTISSSLGNPFCPSADGTVLTATSGNKYTGKKTVL